MVVAVGFLISVCLIGQAVSRAPSEDAGEYGLVVNETSSQSEGSPIEPRCTAEERQVWIQNPEFTLKYQSASSRAVGSAEGTTKRLVAMYGDRISEQCLSCLGDATECGRNNCLLVCLINQAAPDCRRCVNLYCVPALHACTGAADESQLPNTPVVITDVTTTTAPTFAIRSRPSIKARPTTEPVPPVVVNVPHVARQSVTDNTGSGINEVRRKVWSGVYVALPSDEGGYPDQEWTTWRRFIRCWRHVWNKYFCCGS